MNVYEKLNLARQKFHALPLKKTGHNKFAGYYYFELGDFLIPALNVFGEVGLCAYVSFDEDKACMLIRSVEKPEECITLYSPMGSAALKGCHEVQNIGAVETYQRRYLWVAALEIVEHDALDATTGQEKQGANSLENQLKESIEQAKRKEAPRTTAMKVRGKIQEHLAAGRELGALEEWQSIHALAVPPDVAEEIAHIVWAGLTTPEREDIRRLQNEAERKAHA